MKTILLTWNPSRWNWATFEEDRKKLQKNGGFVDRWSCGRIRQIHEGDRFFLMRLGQTPLGKGLVGSGRVIGEVFEDQHWDETYTTLGKISLYTPIAFDRLEETPIISEDVLNRPPLDVINWFPQSSGTTVPSDIAEKLEALWNGGGELSDGSNHPTGVFIEGKPYTQVLTKYERDENARKACLAHYGRTCICCGFEFAKIYGPSADGFIHVHHLVQVSQFGQSHAVDPIHDLNPVCPNCHAVIHLRKVPYTIDEVKTMLERQRGG